MSPFLAGTYRGSLRTRWLRHGVRASRPPAAQVRAQSARSARPRPRHPRPARPRQRRRCGHGPHAAKQPKRAWCTLPPASSGSRSSPRPGHLSLAAAPARPADSASAGRAFLPVVQRKATLIEIQDRLLDGSGRMELAEASVSYPRRPPAARRRQTSDGCRCLPVPGGHACQIRPDPAATTPPRRSKGPTAFWRSGL